MILYYVIAYLRYIKTPEDQFAFEMPLNTASDMWSQNVWNNIKECIEYFASTTQKLLLLLKLSKV